MTNEQKRLLAPLLIVAALVVHCWISLLTSNIIPQWQQYIGLVFFIPLPVLFFLRIRLCVLSLGIYLLIATFNGLAFTPIINTSWLRIGPLRTPPVQLLSLGLFILYLILNLDTLIEMRLDYQDRKQTIR